MSTLAERLKYARELAGLSQSQLGARSGSTQASIGNIESGLRLQPRNLLEISQVLGIRPEWLKSGKGPMRGDSTPPGSGVAHASALAWVKVPPEITWGDISTMPAPQLPEEFVLHMPDDALAPHTPRGTPLIFSTVRHPAPGDGVLVEDSARRRFVRRYAEASQGAWAALARDPAYPSLTSAADGLVLLATVRGRLSSEV